MKKNILIIDESLFEKLIGKIDRLDEKVDTIMASGKNRGLKNKWFVSAEVCKLLNISKRTLQKMRDNGTIEFTKTGKKCYYKATSIDKFMENHSG